MKNVEKRVLDLVKKDAVEAFHIGEDDSDYTNLKVEIIGNDGQNYVVAAGATADDGIKTHVYEVRATKKRAKIVNNHPGYRYFAKDVDF